MRAAVLVFGWAAWVWVFGGVLLMPALGSGVWSAPAEGLLQMFVLLSSPVDQASARWIFGAFLFMKYAGFILLAYYSGRRRATPNP